MRCVRSFTCGTSHLPACCKRPCMEYKVRLLALLQRTKCGDTRTRRARGTCRKTGDLKGTLDSLSASIPRGRKAPTAMWPHIICLRTLSGGKISGVSGPRDRARGLLWLSPLISESLFRVPPCSACTLLYDTLCGLLVQDGSRKFPPSWSSREGYSY